ncbi:sensor histidine kinase [Pseudopedobacter sp.]|uniref:sensor histidine kinase n=1 Tax=Pseudopedobacter sp. TaxID=1936787 RepID=UPI00333FEB18
MNWKKKASLHALIWLFLVAIFTLVATGGLNSSQGFLIHFLIMSVWNIIIFYTNLYFIIPATLNKRKFFLWIAACSVLVIIFAFLKYFESFYMFNLSDMEISIKGKKIVKNEFWTDMISHLMVNGFFIFLSTVYKFTVDWFFNEKEKNDLEKQSLTAELSFLRSQINPHFLFNSLNNIYSLAYQKSDDAPTAILKLSEIMRYMLYESNDENVLLSKEINYLQSYIDLQKLRLKGEGQIELLVEGNIDSQVIVPLMLISFVENAFKHGVATDPEHPIKINISVFENNLLFTLSNLKNKQLNKDKTGGIGMSNVKRRLDLTYPNRYKLNVENNADDYFCELYLNL